MNLRNKVIGLVVVIWLFTLNVFLPEQYIGSSGIDYLWSLPLYRIRDIISLASLAIALVGYVLLVVLLVRDKTRNGYRPIQFWLLVVPIGVVVIAQLYLTVYPG